jgi:hypothetical protein
MHSQKRILNIQLLDLRTQSADGVGAHRRALWRRDRPVGVIPIVRSRQLFGEFNGTLLDREEEFDALIGCEGRHIADVAGEGDAGEGRRDIPAARYRQVKKSIRRHRATQDANNSH